MTFIEVINESKIYQSGQEKIYANDQVNFEIEKGELAIILGSSGAGKSTVLNILGGMDTNDEGEVIIDEEKISNFSNKELFTKKYFDWTGSTSLGQYFQSSMSSHYEWAYKKIKLHKKTSEL